MHICSCPKFTLNKHITAGSKYILHGTRHFLNITLREFAGDVALGIKIVTITTKCICNIQRISISYIRKEIRHRHSRRYIETTGHIIVSLENVVGLVYKSSKVVLTSVGVYINRIATRFTSITSTSVCKANRYGTQEAFDFRREHIKVKNVTERDGIAIFEQTDEYVITRSEVLVEYLVGQECFYRYLFDDDKVIYICIVTYDRITYIFVNRRSSPVIDVLNTLTL